MTKMMTPGGAEHHQRSRGRQVRLELLHGVVPHQGGAQLQQGGKKTNLQNINKTKRQKRKFWGEDVRFGVQMGKDLLKPKSCTKALNLNLATLIQEPGAPSCGKQKR